VNRCAGPRRPGRGLSRSIAVAAFLCLASIALPAQSPPPSGGDDLNGLFTDNGTPATGSTPAAQPAPGQNAPSGSTVRSDDPTQDQKIHYFANLDIYGLFGLGWANLPNTGNLESGLGHEASGSLTASLGVDLRPAPQLRLQGVFSYGFPKTGTQLSEMIVDYSVRESVFFRLGIFNYTWGNSQFFQFSNLPARGRSDWGISNEPLWQQTNILTSTANLNLPVTAKMSIPFGLNSLTFLARFDMQNYGFPDATTPDPQDAGYGIQYDMVTGPIEWTLAGFWQHLLTPRTSLSLKTHFLGFDFSAETTMAFPVRLTLSGGLPQNPPPTAGGIYVGGMMQRIYPTVVLGLSREWTDARIKLYMEYAYNGERDQGTSWLADESGPGGHNSAVVLRFGNMASSGISLNLLWQQNWSDGSGLVSPLFEISPVPLTTIQLGPVFLYGPNGGEVFSNRLVPGNKQLELLLLVKVSDTFRQ
jgi:hypothetical protein